MESALLPETLTYFGILRAPTSWAKVCRELVSALIRRGVDLNIFERKGFLYDPGWDLPGEVTARITNAFRPGDAVFTFEHPNAYAYLQGTKKIGLLTYESTVVPDAWIDQAREHLDLLLVSSSYCRDIFLEAGMDPDRLDILHYGYDPAVFRPDGPRFDLRPYTDRTFVFLNVLSPHKRKGLEVLLQAYRNAFTAADDVSLVLKVNYLPHPSRGKPFEYRNLERIVDEFRRSADSPHLVLLHGYFDEATMASLYRSASCLVSATRAEGFGMVFLEALACGLPVIVTGWSGHRDFLSDDNATLISYTLRTAGEIQYDCNSIHAKVAEPDVHDLAKHMFLAAKRPHRLPHAPPSPEYTWDALADRLLRHIAAATGR